MSQREVTHLHGYPADPAVLEKLNKVVPLHLRFRPTPQHHRATCARCSQGVWLGPRQAQAAASPFIETLIWCTLCVMTVDADVEITGLNLNA